MREMKDSGIEWIGEIPLEWCIRKVKNIARRKSDKNMPDEQVLSLYRELGIVIKSERDDNYNVTSENTANYKYVEVDDLVVNKMKAWQGSIAVSPYKGIVSPAYYVYKIFDQNVYPWFAHYMLRCKVFLPEYRRLSGGIRLGQWDLSDDSFKNITIPIPASYEEQKRIVVYLNDKCFKIDSIIAKQEAIIEKLKEYKLSIISEAVTKGLNPNAEMKDSGIEWLRFIPSCSEIVRFQDLGDFRKGPFGSSITRDMFIEKSDRAFKVYEQKNAIYKDASLGYYYIDEDKYRELSNFAINPGDIIVSCAGTIGECYILPVSCEKGIINQALMRIRIADDVNARYIVYLFSAVLKYYSEKYSNGSAIKNMPPFSIIKKIRVPRFPYDMQCEIADWLDVKINQIDKAISRLTMETDMLHQYEKELLFEVVTGKKEV